MYAVIDTETTGLLPSHRHRVIEIAVVLLDARGQVEREWVTWLNPQRDLGPQ
ncbi:exonuclease domain-containing protein, partial [Kribbella sp.]|uniref:exonuclease domain-containing protein n=1 Tax=Kribbella sp. TaxID=1871183 RepID=UPI002D5E12A5